MTDQPAGGETARTFAPLLADPAHALVACDYDGTLAPIVADPALAVPADGAVEALVALAGRVGLLAIVTGRAVPDVLRLGGLERVPGLVVCGLYGDQRWVAGRLEEGAPAPGLPDARQDIARLLVGADPGVRLEDKGRSVALHTRRAAQPQAELERWHAPLAEIAGRHGLRLDTGRFVLELRPPGSDKGSVVAQLAAQVRATSVVFAGDDVGDLAAFSALGVLAAQGVSTWALAAGSVEVPEVTAAADLVVDGPAGVVRLLRELGQLLG